nr:unnamed protein product [Callosobruchus chinensis]
MQRLDICIRKINADFTILGYR